MEVNFKLSTLTRSSEFLLLQKTEHHPANNAIFNPSLTTKMAINFHLFSK